MITVGIDLAAQPQRTGVVVIDWDAFAVTFAGNGQTDDDLLDVCRSAAERGGKVGIDCALGWPRAFTRFVSEHAAHELAPHNETDTRDLRLRATDQDVHARIGITPLSVSTNLLGIPAFRAARLLSNLQSEGFGVSRVGTELVAEVYPIACRQIWGLPRKSRDIDDVLSQLPFEVNEEMRAAVENEHVFDALIAALGARAVSLGFTSGPPAELTDIAEEEGWIRLPECSLKEVQ